MARRKDKRPKQTVERATPSRSTFKVAAALEQARRELPDTLFTPKPGANRVDRKAVTKTQAPLESRGAYVDLTPEAVKAKAKAARELRVTKPEPETVPEDRRDNCKGRPSNVRTGNGARRNFVPWCRK